MVYATRFHSNNSIDFYRIWIGLFLKPTKEGGGFKGRVVLCIMGIITLTLNTQALAECSPRRLKVFYLIVSLNSDFISRIAASLSLSM